ncbi:MAG: TPM domain-containing protein [Acidobacteriia bacterium]|nr:TPM domain-containing protein [Terriglobia bacterium]
MKRSLLFLLLPLAAALAADLSLLTPQGHVSDFAGVIDPASRNGIERYCAQVKAATGAEIAIVTLPSLDGEPIEDAANTLFRKWGIGSKKNNEGVLFLFAIAERRSRLEVGYGLEPIFPDGFSGSLLRAMRPALREKHYGDAFIVATREIGERIAREKNVKIDTAPPLTHRNRPAESLPWPALLGVLVLLLFLFGASGGPGGFLLSMLLGNLLGGGLRYGGRHGGGGFGGYDSGDSFGGFGGGDSGGGGASSDW